MVRFGCRDYGDNRWREDVVEITRDGAAMLRWGGCFSSTIAGRKGLVAG